MKCSRFLDLDPDEVSHRRRIAVEDRLNLDLANNAALLTLKGLEGTDEIPTTDPQRGFVTLLLTKSAQDLRFAVMGLTLGYYSGASAVLRSAVESLQFAILFHEEPESLTKWLKSELASEKDRDRHRRRSELSQAAREALLRWETERETIEPAIEEYWVQANKRIHATLVGVAEHFGLTVGDLIPHDSLEALIASGGDLNEVIEIYPITSAETMSLHEQSKQPRSRWIDVSAGNRYDEETLAEFGDFAFYVGHRLLDWAADIFEPKAPGFVDGNKEWHDQVQQRVLDR